MSRNRHHPVRLAKGGKRLAPDKREGVGLIATAGMAAVVALMYREYPLRQFNLKEWEIVKEEETR